MHARRPLDRNASQEGWPVTDRARASVLPLLGFVVFLALFVPALSAGVGSVAQDAGPETQIGGESITVSYGDRIDVDESGDGYSESVTVVRPIENSSDEQLVAGDDYTWDGGTGTIRFLEGGDTTAGETLEIDYSVFAAPAETDQSLAFLTPIVQVAPWLLVLLAGLLAIKLVGEGWY
jgi:hypothetical protein